MLSSLYIIYLGTMCCAGIEGPWAYVIDVMVNKQVYAISRRCYHEATNVVSV